MTSSPATPRDAWQGRISCCPKCGGSNGFEGVLVMRYLMTGAWGSPWETSGSEQATYRSPSVRCVDCGHRVDTGAAEGYDLQATTQRPPTIEQ